MAWMWPKQMYCVYRAYDARGDLLYVGATKDLYSRMKLHKYKSVWYPLMQCVHVERFSTADEAADREIELIGQFSPAHNRNTARYWDSAPHYTPHQPTPLPNMPFIVEDLPPVFLPTNPNPRYRLPVTRHR